MREEEIKNSIDEVKKRVDSNKEIREALLLKLHKTAMNVDLNTTNAKELSAKLEIFSTLNSMLDSHSKDASLLTKTYLSEKSTDQDVAVGKQAVAFLKEIKGIETIPGSFMQPGDLDNVDKILDEVDTEEITPEELLD